VSPSTNEVGGLARAPAGRVVVAGTTAVAQSFGVFASRYRRTRRANGSLPLELTADG
jgi:hypothetical protein